MRGMWQEGLWYVHRNSNTVPNVRQVGGNVYATRLAFIVSHPTKLGSLTARPLNSGMPGRWSACQGDWDGGVLSTFIVVPSLSSLPAVLPCVCLFIYTTIGCVHTGVATCVCWQSYPGQTSPALVWPLSKWIGKTFSYSHRSPLGFDVDLLNVTTESASRLSIRLSMRRHSTTAHTLTVAVPQLSQLLHHIRQLSCFFMGHGVRNLLYNTAEEFSHQKTVCGVSPL